MNLPNKLTMLRMVMVPFFVAAMVLESLPGARLAALILFVAASLTDLLDGKIARSRGLVTDFGKLMDPLADKLLVMSALVMMMERMDLSGVVVIILLAREFLVTSLRLIAASGGKVIAAGQLGTAKTVVQMVWIVYSLAAYAGVLPWWNGLYLAGAALATLLSLVSGFEYVWGNRSLLADR